MGYYIERFEQCYKKTCCQLKNLDFSDSVDLAKVFGSEGLKREHVGVIDALRTTISKGKNGGAKTEGKVLADGCAASKGRSLVGLVSNAFSEVNDRVAAVKMARHMYLM
ncbi:MAG: hypothetical protein ACI9KK_002836 [Ascidiaceihabitans sp.]